LNDLEIDLPGPQWDCTHTIRVTLQFIEVAIEELAPERLRGYGEVPGSLFQSLAGGLHEMKGIVRQLDSYLMQRADADLHVRLAQLSSAGDLGSLLSALGRLVDEYGFVEFRTPLSWLVEKVAAPTYEIAFFGRVSAGKSSLLNRIIGSDLLPTGVTPVTAVPTRIRNRPDRSLLVWTAEGGVTKYDIDRLADFVTEQRNPGNSKRVTRLIAEAPLGTLPQNIVLVDTPGLGSLALEGAAETLAYLPQCDLGVVLVDASSSLHADDIATLDALRTASVPAIVVISKADLLSAPELDRLVTYTRDQISEQLRLGIDVTPLSSQPVMAHVLEAWVRNKIAPRIASAAQLAQESNQRKAAMLGERVLYALRTSLSVAAHREYTADRQELKNAETQLREVASLFESTSLDCFRIAGEIREAAGAALEVVVERAAETFANDPGVRELNGEWVQKGVNLLAQNEAEKLAAVILSIAGRLSEALDTAARATATDHGVEAASLQDHVKELPPPEAPLSSIALRRPRLTFVSLALARRSLRGQLESQCGNALRQFFNQYGRALEPWFRNRLNALQRDFDASAEIYRAQVQRLISADSQQEFDREALLTDLSLLSGLLGCTGAIESVESHATA